jgi:hypothetical protein
MQIISKGVSNNFMREHKSMASQENYFEEYYKILSRDSVTVWGLDW